MASAILSMNCFESGTLEHVLGPWEAAQRSYEHQTEDKR